MYTADGIPMTPTLPGAGEGPEQAVYQAERVVVDVVSRALQESDTRTTNAAHGGC